MSEISIGLKSYYDKSILTLIDKEGKTDILIPLYGHDEIVKLILDEKIQSLLDIDEAMINALLNAKVDRNGNEVTIGIATQTWNETHWHKIILEQINKLRNLRKEIE